MALPRLKLPHWLCEMTATTHSERQFQQRRESFKNFGESSFWNTTNNCTSSCDW